MSAELAASVHDDISPWDDAVRATQIFRVLATAGTNSVKPVFLVRGAGELARQALLAALPNGTLKHLSANTSLERFGGCLDLAATLACGERVEAAPLLKEGNVGALNVSFELEPEFIHRLTAWLEEGGAGGLIVFDDGNEPYDALAEHASIFLDLHGVRHFQIKPVPQAQALAARAVCDDESISRICAMALALGLPSTRTGLGAVQVSIANARLCCRDQVSPPDVELAARLCLLHRATRLPQLEEDACSQNDDVEPSNSHQQSNFNDRDSNSSMEQAEGSGEIDVQALLANLPADLLASLAQKQESRISSSRMGRKARHDNQAKHGRPGRCHRRRPRGGERLDLVQTLRAAAPWQRIRRGDESGSDGCVKLRVSDLHVKSFRKSKPSSTIFAVDASGSTALARLGEAKGAVEQLLSQSYVNRDEVSLVAFNGSCARLELPPTRSLTRAKRLLSNLTGGGGTPLAHGLQIALSTAQAERRNGHLPRIVFLTDGSANVCLSGQGNRKAAMDDALLMADSVRASDIPVLLIDVARIPKASTQELARRMGARHMPLPFVSSRALARAIQATDG